MKKYKFIIITIIVVTFLSSCRLNEEPPFVSEGTAYSSIENIRASLDGVYNALTNYDYYGYELIYSTYCNSGLFLSGRGNSNQDPDNLTLSSLKPMATPKYTESPWYGIYTAIDRANRLISHVQVAENPQSSDETYKNDLVGEAYFIRALSYFNLVRMWGAVPLRLEPTTTENVSIEKSAIDVIYEQIIKDAKMAEELMFHRPLNRQGYPASEAASMLLAKIYMTLATTDDPVPAEYQNENDCWMLAYDEAKKCYGKYSLNQNYSDIYYDATSDDTPESIFELQFSQIVTSQLGRMFTASKAVRAVTWGRIKINAELFDQHVNCYPNDTKRLDETFKSLYTQYATGKVIKNYPFAERTKFSKAFPYLYKYWQKNRNAATSYTSQNYLVFRYADLLLMLAEISNELDNGEQFDYVNEVLARVGLSVDDFVPDPVTGADYYGGKEGFRKAIFLEYRFELLGEGLDWFNNRRRGYQFFKDMVIDPHNNYTLFNEKVDVTLSDNPDKVMHFPMPQSEINMNELISN
jgi:hypothetical protein